MKRNIICIIVMIFCLSVYTEDLSVLNGKWESQFFYDNMTSNPISYADYENNQRYGIISITIKSDGTGSYHKAGIRSFGISRVEQQGGKDFILYLCVEDETLVGEVYITVLNEDSIFVTNEEGFIGSGPIYEEPWYRVSGPAKIPVQRGVINDTRVRLRTKPNLECDVWGFFNTGDKVTIIDKSAETQKIDDMEDYWYKVRTYDFPDGWVYGAFIDIEEEN